MVGASLRTPLGQSSCKCDVTSRIGGFQNGGQICCCRGGIKIKNLSGITWSYVDKKPVNGTYLD